MGNNSSKPLILKNAREAKGLTLEKVHAATKIPMESLKAIEEESPLSASANRAFIIIYARFLGLDPSAMIIHYGLDRRVGGNRN